MKEIFNVEVEVPRLPENLNSALALVLELLWQRAGEWVPMPELASYARTYRVGGIVSDLRRLGHQVENRQAVGKRADGSKVRKSWYRLVPRETAQVTR